MAKKRYRRRPYIHGTELLAALGVDSEAAAWLRVWQLRLPYWATARASALVFRRRQLDRALKREARGEVPACCLLCCPAFRWCTDTPARMLVTLRKGHETKAPSGADGDGGPRTAGTGKGSMGARSVAPGARDARLI